MPSKMNWFISKSVLKPIHLLAFLLFRIRNRIGYEIENVLPEPIGRAAKHCQYMRHKKLFHKQIAKMTGLTPIEVEEGPVQSPEVALDTSVMTKRGVKGAIDPDLYFTFTYKTMNRFLQELEEMDFNLANINTILDFGCGSARFGRILQCIPRIRIIGTDKNIRCIEWCRENIPGVEFYVNQEIPPLSFAEDNSIDLIIANSVFTHIPIEIQRKWLQELFRITVPGGVVLCTVLGNYHICRMLNPHERKQLSEEGHYSMRPNCDRISLSSKMTCQDDVFQTHTELLRVFGEFFKVLIHKSTESQDILVLQKPLSI